MKKSLYTFTKNTLFILCLGAAALFFACSDFNPYGVDNTKHRAEASFSYSVNSDNQNRLVLKAINGSVEIIGVSGASMVEISGVRIVQSESQRDAERHLEQLDVNINVNTNRGAVEVETDQPSNTSGREYIVEYVIRVPAEWHIDLNHANGEVQVDSIAGTVDIDHVNGNVHLNETTGELFVDLTNGQILGRTGYTTETGVCKLTAVNGQIRMSIPKASNGAFSAAVTNGSVSVSSLVLQNMTSRQNAVTGTLGNGEGEITLHVINGNIDVVGY